MKERVTEKYQNLGNVKIDGLLVYFSKDNEEYETGHQDYESSEH